MKKVELVSLKCEKFKSFENKEFFFDGKNVSVFGANGTGKSTLNDAFLWLMFGKNAAGETDFEIKPKGKDGALMFPGAETVVEGTIRIDGSSVCLKRVLKEVWTAKRGSVEKVFSGNTTDYFVDGFPVKKGEYEKKISEIVAEDVFRLISSTTNFFKMSPKDQRSVLFGLTNGFTDEELAAGHPDFSSLCEELSGHTVEELRKKLALERRNLSENRNTIPARLDELSKMKSALYGIDFNAAREKLDRASTEKEKLILEKSKAESDLNVNEWEQKLNECCSEIKLIEKENQLYKSSQNTESKYSRDKLIQQDRVGYLDQTTFRVKNEIARTKNELDFLENQVQSLREEYVAEDKKKPVFGKECPTCKRPYEEAALRATETKMLSEKKARMEEITRRAGVIGEQIEKYKADLSTLEKELESAEKDLASAKEKLSELIQKEKLEKSVPVSDMPNYGAKMEGLLAQKKAIQDMIQTKRTEKDHTICEIDKKLSEITCEIYACQSELSKESTLEDANKRTAELEMIARNYAERIEEIDKKIFLCESFTKYKVSVIEESINGKFEITTFSLFKEQINGGIADTCEAMKDGIPYSDLNNGSKVNVGIDVANSLSKNYGVSVPLFVDNAEGVTNILQSYGQSIKLYVSKNDEELRSVTE